MKKHLVLLSLFFPAVTFAQSPADVFSLVGFLIGLAIIIGLFYLFRSILLWYWKVDDIVKNQEETNRLLRSIVRHIESKDDHLNNQDNL